MASTEAEGLEADDKRSNVMICEALNPCISSETFTKEVAEEQNVNSSSSCTLASQSQFSCDVDRWIRGSSVESTDGRNSRVQLVQRSTVATTASSGVSGIWYIMAIMLPLFNGEFDYNIWRCHPSTILNVAGLLFTNLSAFCQAMRERVRNLVRDQVATIYNSAMEVVLTVYAVGFVIITMYQASIIG